MSTPKAQITRGGAQRRRENSRGGQSAPYSQNAGQVDVRRQEQQDSGQADAEDDVEQAAARRQPGAVGALDPDDGQHQDPGGRPQDGDAAVPQQGDGWDSRQAKGNEDNTDGAVGLLVLGLLGMRVMSHGQEPIGAWGAGP